jgi:hypothetical protein
MMAPKLCLLCNKIFESITWYHCPICGQHGFASMWNDGCTICSNRRLFNDDGTHKIPHPSWTKEEQEKWLKEKGLEHD